MERTVSGGTITFSHRGRHRDMGYNERRAQGNQRLNSDWWNRVCFRTLSKRWLAFFSIFDIRLSLGYHFRFPDPGL